MTLVFVDIKAADDVIKEHKKVIKSIKTSSSEVKREDVQCLTFYRKPSFGFVNELQNARSSACEIVFTL